MPKFAKTLSLMMALPLVLAMGAQARPLSDGQNGYKLGCSVYEFVEVEVNGERFHCPEYSHPFAKERDYWPEDYGHDNPFGNSELDDAIRDIGGGGGENCFVGCPPTNLQ